MLSVVICGCDPSTVEAEVGGSQDQGHLAYRVSLSPACTTCLDPVWGGDCVVEGLPSTWEP